MILMTGAVFLVAIAVCIVAAYAMWLITARRAAPVMRPAMMVPRVLIVVPVFDEAPLIVAKLENLAVLIDAHELCRVVIADGGSTDGTIPLIREWIAARPRFALRETQLRNKTAQLNDAMLLSEGEPWVLVTDADALLAADTLPRLLAVAADPTIGVVGARVRPTAAHALESLHWRATDWLREREFERGSAAIVAAPCYLLRRELLVDLPTDVIADDVHVACRAMRTGLRVGHSDVVVQELRSPRAIVALLRHKYRKADAYLREIARFLPALSRMPQPMRAIFLWRAALLTVVPLCGIGGGIASAVVLTGTYPLALAVSAVAFALTFPFAPARAIARGIALAAVLAAVSALALLTYPFSRQAASFPKIVQPWEYRMPDEAPSIE
jgi:hypothetical protein